MPTSVTQLIHSSFRLIGAIASGETLETAELSDAFISLNQFVSLWNTEGTMIAERKKYTMTVGSTNAYVLTSERPIHIEAASVASGGIDSPLEIVDATGWEAVPEKQAQSVYVKVLYCDYEYPIANIYIAPIPRLGGTLEMIIWEHMAAFSDVNQVIDLPYGYEMALRYNFALALQPEYPRGQADPSLPALAQSYKASIQQLNALNHMKRMAPAAAPGVAA